MRAAWGAHAAGIFWIGPGVSAHLQRPHSSAENAVVRSSGRLAVRETATARAGVTGAGRSWWREKTSWMCLLPFYMCLTRRLFREARRGARPADVPLLCTCRHVCAGRLCVMSACACVHVCAQHLMQIIVYVKQERFEIFSPAHASARRHNHTHAHTQLHTDTPTNTHTHMY